MTRKKVIKTSVSLLSALLRHRLEKIAGPEALEILANELIGMSEGAIDERIDGIFLETKFNEQITAAAEKAPPYCPPGR